MAPEGLKAQTSAALFAPLLFVTMSVIPMTACFRPPISRDTPESRLNWAMSRQRAVTPGHCPDTSSSTRELVALALANNAGLAAREAEAKRLEAFSNLAQADAPSLRVSETRLDRIIDGPPRAAFDLRVPLARPGTLAAEDELMRRRLQWCGPSSATRVVSSRAT